MKNISWSQLKIILALVAGTAVLLALIGALRYRPGGTDIVMEEPESISAAWVLETDEDYDRAVELPCHLEVQKGEPVSISRYLPDTLQEDYGIAFYSVYNQVQVKIGDTVVYQYGVSDGGTWYRSPAPHWNLVPIDSQYAGEQITITLISEYGSYAGLFPAVYGGSCSALIAREWKTNGWSTIASLVLLFLTVGFFAAVLIQKEFRRPDRRIGLYGMLLAAVSLWSVSGNPVVIGMTRYGYVWWLIHILTRMLIPILYLLFLRGFLQKRRMLILTDIGILTGAALYAAAVILQLMGLVEFPQSYEPLGHIYQAGFLLYTVVLTVGWLQYRRRELRTIAVSQLLLTAAGIVNLFLQPNHLYQTTGTFWQIAASVYLFLLLGAAAETLLEQVQERVSSVEEGYTGQRTAAVAMMNPNFLFAALNSLLSMTKTGSRNSSKFVFAFSRYLRYNLDSVQKDGLIPFSEELEHIAAYLELQRLRMPGLTVEIEDKQHAFSVPRRSVEAIVENAVKHGIGGAEQTGMVTVRSYERRDSYAVQIVDDGSGFDTDLLYHKETPTSMKTVRRRLNQLAGGTVEVSSRPGKGTIVTVRFPKKQRQTDAESDVG